jgi:hypothetical protein
VSKPSHIEPEKAEPMSLIGSGALALQSNLDTVPEAGKNCARMLCSVSKNLKRDCSMNADVSVARIGLSTRERGSLTLTITVFRMGHVASDMFATSSPFSHSLPYLCIHSG